MSKLKDWRERNLWLQEQGVRFEWSNPVGGWYRVSRLTFILDENRYRVYHDDVAKAEALLEERQRQEETKALAERLRDLLMTDAQHIKNVSKTPTELLRELAHLRAENEALRAALEAPEPEPVAMIGTNGELVWIKRPNVVYSKPLPLYTHPIETRVREVK